MRIVRRLNRRSPHCWQAHPISRADEGQVVWLEGTFQGWQVSGCRFPEGAVSKGRTRSDWLIRLGSDCYYVTGGFPAGLDAFDPAHIGVRISLEARPLRDEGGKLYLEYRSSKRIP